MESLGPERNIMCLFESRRECQQWNPRPAPHRSSASRALRMSTDILRYSRAFKDTGYGDRRTCNLMLLLGVKESSVDPILYAKINGIPQNKDAKSPPEHTVTPGQ